MINQNLDKILNKKHFSIIFHYYLFSYYKYSQTS